MDMPRADLWTIPHNVNMTVNPSNDNNLLQRFTDKFNDEHAKKVKEVRHAFGLAGGDAMNSLVMIDTIHRLGIDYHFKREIDSKLHLDSSNWYFIELQNKAREILPYLHGRSIYLVGMMGSGKTTVGKILSEVLEYSFCDSDLLVEANVGGMSVAEIFKLYGEGYFRDKESEALRYLSLMHRLVVSTGGGAVTRPINWNYMHKGISVYIDVPLEALAQRIAAVGTASRPLLHQELGDAYTKDKFNDEHTKKVKEVRDAFRLAGGDAMKSLVMIDTLHRLGIDYHFKREIDSILKTCYASFGANLDKRQDLEETALHFRLLRREGYNVSQDVFIRFMDDEGKFKNDLIEDINGLMSLYEASQLRMEGEKILEDAKYFAERILSDFCTHHSNHQAAMVNKTLKHPHHKTLARFYSKNFFQTYEGESKMKTNYVLCELAKLDLSIFQSLYQNEASQVSKWWDEIGLSKELKLARNQPIKWYMWPLATVEDPRLSEERIELTKPISLVYIVDDIFDVYGTIEQLSLFTEVVSRWDHAAAQKLPDYMKMCFKALNDTTNEMSYKIMKRIGWSPADVLRKSWATLFNAFLVEAKWLSSNMPSADEYLKNGVVSIGVHVILLHFFFLLEDGVNAASIRYLTDGGPCIFDSIGRILRLWNDFGSAKDENQKGKDGSYLDCYMKENKGVSIASAKEHVSLMISETWERLNEDAFSPSPLSTSFIKCILNVARIIPLVYNYDDIHCLPGLEEQLKSILYSSLP